MSYDFSLTTFNPSGKLLQIEYALQTVQKGQTAVGIRATNGVVIAVEKTIKTLLIDPDTQQKIATISPNTCLTYAGIGPDFRVLVAGARKAASRYYNSYHEHIPVMILVQRVAGVMQEYTQSGGVRPFGCSVILAGVRACARVPPVDVVW
jgi:20S proteasome subunit alpha 2